MPEPSDANAPLLSVRGLTTVFHTDAGVARAVTDVSFDVRVGQTLALVGESGCGKSVTALSIMRLLAAPPAEIAAGEVFFAGRDLLLLPEREMRAVRGAGIAMIFQEPQSSLNPVFTVGEQIAEAAVCHGLAKRKEALAMAVQALADVQIADPERLVRQYPHELSGGMKQRVMIAMALIAKPRLLIADEPTTALDITIQAQILDLLRELQQARDMAILLITHDLGVVAEMAREVAVMYASRIVERAPVEALFAAPLHPYTQGLLRSLPKSGTARGALASIPGTVPPATSFPPGCAFHPRCALRAAADETGRCPVDPPALTAHGGGQFAACHYAAVAV